ncbi:MAG: hypothetical protein J7576_04110 [Siphonobacter aquaeclarae]|nr:hypothetical protein [Siphonobacter aquaeclarae]
MDDPIGVNDGALAVRGAGARTLVRISPDGRRGLRLLAEGGSRLYLRLENIRGTRDATVLNVYLFGMPDEPGSRLAGSAGLFGLRLASVPEGDNQGAGLTFVFDVTALLPGLETDALPVGIVPVHPLSELSDVVVERVSLFFRPTE